MPSELARLLDSEQEGVLALAFRVDPFRFAQALVGLLATRAEAGASEALEASSHILKGYQSDWLHAVRSESPDDRWSGLLRAWDELASRDEARAMSNLHAFEDEIRAIIGTHMLTVFTEGR